MYEIGLRDYDKIKAVNNEPIVYFEDIPKKFSSAVVEIFPITKKAGI